MEVYKEINIEGEKLTLRFLFDNDFEHNFLTTNGKTHQWMEWKDFFLNIKGSKFYTENGFEIKTEEQLINWIEAHGVRLG